MIYPSLLLSLGAVSLLGCVDAAELILAQGGAKKTGGYIVTLKEHDTSMSQEELDVVIRSETEGIASDAGATVDAVYTEALQGFAAHLDDEALEKVLNNPSVAMVEEDSEVSVSLDTWGLDRIDEVDLTLDGKYAPKFGNGGAGVIAYIIDTGILSSHVEFNGRATQEINFAGGANIDCNGHGTHVAGTVGSTLYGVAPKVQLVGVKVLSCSGGGTWSGVISGINWVITDAKKKGKPATANMSLGGGKNTAVNTAVANLVKSGVPTVVAAGNSNRNSNGYSPASELTAITVASTDKYDKRSSFSNYGSNVDIFAPGTNIRAPWIGSSNTVLRTISGTSMASPHVCGAVALYQNENPNLAPDAILAKMLDDAVQDKITDPQGTPNKLVYVGADQTPTPPTTSAPTTKPSMMPSTPSSSFGPTPSSFRTGAPTGSGDSPTSAPTIDCTSLTKNKQCKKFKDVCVYGKKKKIDDDCKPKKPNYECDDFNDEDECQNADDICQWQNGACVSLCVDLARQPCKKVKGGPNNKKICNMKKLPNPCYKCQPISKCGP